MGLGKYAVACDDLANELRNTLTDTDIAELHRMFQGHSVSYWGGLRMTHQDLISRFVGSTPSQRNGRRFRENKLFLTMAGIQHCREAEAILTELNSSFLEPGGSYRDMAARAGEAYVRLLCFDIPVWPFDELESPFIDE